MICPFCIIWFFFFFFLLTTFCGNECHSLFIYCMEKIFPFMRLEFVVFLFHLLSPFLFVRQVWWTKALNMSSLEYSLFFGYVFLADILSEKNNPLLFSSSEMRFSSSFSEALVISQYIFLRWTHHYCTVYLKETHNAAYLYNGILIISLLFFIPIHIHVSNLFTFVWLEPHMELK